MRSSRMPNPAEFGSLTTSAVETPTDSTRRRSKRCVVFLCLKSVSTGGHGGPPLKAQQHQVLQNLSSRSAVECRAGGPLAGLVSFRILQASTYSAAGRAGTIHDGNIRARNPKQLPHPSGMVDPLGHKAIPPSSAEPIGHQNFA